MQNIKLLNLYFNFLIAITNQFCHIFLSRWTIALKTLRTKKENEKYGKGSICMNSSTSGYQSNKAGDEEDNVALLMDEAKTMMRVGEYHENIVNLQGIIAKLKDDLTCQV